LYLDWPRILQREIVKRLAMISFFKKWAGFIGRLYFAPFPANSAFFFKVKDLYFSNPAEYLFRFLSLAEPKISPDNVIVDIGAADGRTAIFFKKNIPNSTVYAFEPNELIWNTLTTNTRAITGIIVKKKALAKEAGNMNFHVTANNLSSSLLEIDSIEVQLLPDSHQRLLDEQRLTTVEVSTLDDEMNSIDRIFCIKLDVQGYELEILKGGVDTLSKKNFVIVEMNNHHIYKKGCQYHQVDEFLRSRGFSLADIIVTYRTQHHVREYDAIYERLDNHNK
jgi:FkbM family methyltransferase